MWIYINVLGFFAKIPVSNKELWNMNQIKKNKGIFLRVSLWEICNNFPVAQFPGRKTLIVFSDCLLQQHQDICQGTSWHGIPTCTGSFCCVAECRSFLEVACLSFCQPVLEQDGQVLQERISGEQLVVTVLTHWHQSRFPHKYFLRFWGACPSDETKTISKALLVCNQHGWEQEVVLCNSKQISFCFFLWFSVCEMVIYNRPLF